MVWEKENHREWRAGKTPLNWTDQEYLELFLYRGPMTLLQVRERLPWRQSPECVRIRLWRLAKMGLLTHDHPRIVGDRVWSLNGIERARV